MTDATEPRGRRLKRWLSVVALVTAAAATIMPAARADESAAKALFKAMSDYLAAQSAISFDFDCTDCAPSEQTTRKKSTTCTRKQCQLIHPLIFRS